MKAKILLLSASRTMTISPRSLFYNNIFIYNNIINSVQLCHIQDTEEFPYLWELK